MATLKKLTRVGADVRQIARLLQAKAPEGHMLAYITPEEAELLKSQGGSGKPHADTGIPSYEYDAESYYSVPEGDINVYKEYPNYGETAIYTPSSTDAGLPPMSPQADNTSAFAYPSGFDAPVGADRFAGTSEGASFELPSFAGQTRVTEGAPYEGYANQFAGAFPAGAFAPPEGGAGAGFTPYQIDTTPDKTIGDRFGELAKSLGIEKGTLAKLGVGGVQAVLGGLQSRKAAEQGRKAKEEQQALARPYQAKGAELQRQAQAGELTPVGQQQLQAVQAQAAQQASSRGGAVGAAQMQAQIEAFRNQLLQQQYDYGLKLSGIGDQVALGAIKTGLEADRYANELSSNYAFNIGRALYGQEAVPPKGASRG